MLHTQNNYVSNKKMRRSTASHLDTNAKTIPTLDLSQVHGAPLRLKAHVVRQGCQPNPQTNPPVVTSPFGAPARMLSATTYVGAWVCTALL
jgi:hypothetical protein